MSNNQFKVIEFSIFPQMVINAKPPGGVGKSLFNSSFWRALSHANFAQINHVIDNLTYSSNLTQGMRGNNRVFKSTSHL